MKKILCLFFCLPLLLLVSCGNAAASSVELMGAGDRIHDTFTFANTGVKLDKKSENSYEISGSVEKLESAEIKSEFSIDSDVTHVVAIKLTAINQKVDKNNVNITINGIRAYDAEHLNGSDYTFIILEVIPESTVTINAKWNSTDTEKVYTIYFSGDITLK